MAGQSLPEAGDKLLAGDLLAPGDQRVVKTRPMKDSSGTIVGKTNIFANGDQVVTIGPRRINVQNLGW